MSKIQSVHFAGNSAPPCWLPWIRRRAQRLLADHDLDGALAGLEVDEALAILDYAATTAPYRGQRHTPIAVRSRREGAV